MVRIENLTLGQESRFQEFRNRWTAIGLDATPANHTDAEMAVHAIYRAAGFAPPKKIVWCGSPCSQAMTRDIIMSEGFLKSVLDAVWDNVKSTTGDGLKDSIKDSFNTGVRLVDSSGIKKNVRENVQAAVRQSIQKNMQRNVEKSVWDSTWKNIWESVWIHIESGIEHGLKSVVKSRGTVGGSPLTKLKSSILNSIASNIGPSLRNPVWDDIRDVAWVNIRDNVSSRVRNSAWENVWNTVCADVWDSVAALVSLGIKADSGDSIAAFGYGQHDANWLGFYEYFREVCGLTAETEGLVGLTALAKSAGWFLPHEHICWISERPTFISRDDQGRLHAEQGPALSYEDGWHLYATNGALTSADKIKK